jgi:hypothetical protein
MTVSRLGMAVSQRRCDGDEPESGGTDGVEMAVEVAADATKVTVAADVEMAVEVAADALVGAPPAGHGQMLGIRRSN